LPLRAISIKEPGMSMRLVIVADFSDPACLIMAGPTEESVRPTKYYVSDAQADPLAALKLLGGKYRRALVLDRSFKTESGAPAQRRLFRRSPSGSKPT
jgi:hypothetical protein